eukprot:Plantae.Rhodophyta-Purpureofilum_apyrenoidigerum.ctg8268.p1 GENE.Plantae.Rhodophyta-Purpureofilum_apyrenoidigerum.ctg8268~~Plantae.Rhodophyta-Purpureofilum_apyrenoidigerum.ctg8268.p1  ORF type:complete len:311 (+),score=33.86 Plantae.Rhodophyta-Purpureofilum_apyrenoidigerum.ctg8268:205-1137(+)
MQRLFDRCISIPVDPALSLAKYCAVLKQTLAQAEQYKNAEDNERSALLFIRCVLVANRTLLDHPEYSLPQSEQWQQELRRISGRCLLELEKLKPLVELAISKEKLSDPRAETGRQGSAVEINPNILNVFEKISRQYTSKRIECIGLLCGRLDDISKNVQILRVTALVVPNQHGTDSNCEMLSESTVHSLQEAKGLFTLGWLVTHLGNPQYPTSKELRYHAGFQAMLPECILGIVTPHLDPQYSFFALTDPGGLDFVLRHPERVRDEGLLNVPDGFKGAGKPLYTKANHVQLQAVTSDNAHNFKVYDLRAK